MTARVLTVEKDEGSENSSIPDLVAHSPLSHHFLAQDWKREKQCFICEISLGRGLIRSKKHGCKFCRHAVCESCSPGRRLHPATQELKRICTSCQATWEDETDCGPDFAAIIDLETKLQLEVALRQSFECKSAIAQEKLDAAKEELAASGNRADAAESLARQVQQELLEEREEVRILRETVASIARVSAASQEPGDVKKPQEVLEAVRRLRHLADIGLQSEKAMSGSVVYTLDVGITENLCILPRPRAALGVEAESQCELGPQLSFHTSAVSVLPAECSVLRVTAACALSIMPERRQSVSVGTQTGTDALSTVSSTHGDVTSASAAGESIPTASHPRVRRSMTRYSLSREASKCQNSEALSKQLEDARKPSGSHSDSPSKHSRASPSTEAACQCIVS